MVMRQKGIVSYLQNGTMELGREDIFVTVTLYRVPASLVREFVLKVACQCPGGISEALQDLMKKAIKEQNAYGGDTTQQT